MKKQGLRTLQIASYFIIGVLLILLIGVMRNCSEVKYSSVEGHSGGDTIDIALVYSPGSYYMYADSLAGINKEVAEEFSRQSGLPIKLWPVTDPASALSKLETGNFNILASLPLDNHVKRQFPVSESIFLDRMVLIQLEDSTKKDSLVNSSLDLRGKTVNVPAGSSAVHRLKNLSDEIGESVNIVELEEMSDELLCLQVASGNTPLAIVNERVAKEISRKYPDLNYQNSISFTQFQVWVFNPLDTILCNSFNSWWKNFSQTPAYREILNKY